MPKHKSIAWEWNARTKTWFPKKPQQRSSAAQLQAAAKKTQRERLKSQQILADYEAKLAAAEAAMAKARAEELRLLKTEDYYQYRKSKKRGFTLYTDPNQWGKTDTQRESEKRRRLTPAMVARVRQMRADERRRMINAELEAAREMRARGLI